MGFSAAIETFQRLSNGTVISIETPIRRIALIIVMPLLTRLNISVTNSQSFVRDIACIE